MRFANAKTYFLFLFCIICGSFLIAASASAHVLSYGAIRTELVAQGNQIKLTTEVPQNISYASYYGNTSEFELIQNQFSSSFVISQGGEPCPFTLGSYDNTSTLDQSVFSGTFVCAAPVGIDNLKIHVAVFKESFLTFDHFVSISIGSNEWQLVFNANKQDYPADVPAQYLGTIFDRFLVVLKEFTWLGIEHIWTGYDHILFLLSVILLVRSLKKIFVLVTSFTVAHSITLILASFHVVNISSWIVESCIALSIAYMAYRNIRILRAEQAAVPLSERWVMTFGFGLVHGLGFASALAATNLPAILLVPSVIVFNVGIEIGQLSILAIIIPLLFQVDKLPQRNKILKVFSILVFVLALYWFFQRFLQF